MRHVYRNLGILIRRIRNLMLVILLIVVLMIGVNINHVSLRLKVVKELRLL